MLPTLWDLAPREWAAHLAVYADTCGLSVLSHTAAGLSAVTRRLRPTIKIYWTAGMNSKWLAGLKSAEVSPE
jgi:hypothetical protein